MQIPCKMTDSTIVPNCCKYKANGTRKESQNKNPKPEPKKNLKTILNPFRMVQPLASDVNGEWLEVFQARKCSWIDHILLYYCGRLFTIWFFYHASCVIPADPRRHIEARSLSPVRGIAFPPAFQASGLDSDGFFCGSMEENPVPSSHQR